MTSFVSWRVGSRATLVLVALAATAVPVAPAADAAPKTPVVAEPAPVREAPDGASAVMAARRQGSRVEVVADRTATRAVFANPDGTHTAEFSAIPKWVKRGNEWAAIDPTLVRRPDGLVEARALEGAAALSGGGSDAPLLQVADGPRKLSFYWPGVLPRPVLTGSEATYRDVLPGVDLVMRASTGGYQQLLVVKDRQAARSRALARVELRAETRGLRLSADRAGALRAVDAAGKPVFTSPPSVMWDSSGVAGSRSAPVGVSVSGDVLRLVPDQRFLADPATVYPVFVDPRTDSAWASPWVNLLSGLAAPQWNQSADDKHRDWAQVGQCFNDKGECMNAGRSIGEGWAYFQFDTAFLGDKDVLEANFHTTVAYSPDCGTRAHLLNVLHYAIPSNINWSGKPQYDPPVAEFGAPNACSGWAGVKLNVLGKLNGAGPTTFYLHARDGGDQYAWRKYVTAETKVAVRWNRRPHTPRDLRTDPPLPAPCRWCEGTSYMSNRNVRLKATLDDPDGDQLFPRWRFTTNYVDEVAYDPPGCGACVPQVSGATHDLNIDLTGRENKEIRWWVHGDDGVRASPQADGQMFVPDWTRPGPKPSVTSVAYPDGDVVNEWFGAVGAPGVFTFGPGGDCTKDSSVCDIDHYEYGWKSEPELKVDADKLGGGATVTLAPERYGPQTLYVRSVDRAENESPTREYRILVRDGTGPRGQWSFEGNAKDSAYVGGRHGALQGEASYTAGAVGTGVLLNGGYVTAPKALNTDSSFTVSAWVRADRQQSVVMGALSQEGAENSGWYLDYRADDNKWTFMMVSASGAPEARYVVSKEAPRLGQWTHLTGVYDRAAHTIRLYVNGAVNGSVPLPSTIAPWKAEGPLNVGREKWKGAHANYWRGAIDEVKTWDRVLTDAEIQALVSRDDVRTGQWKFDDPLVVDGQPNSSAENAVTGGLAGTLEGGARFVDGVVEFNGEGAQVVVGRPEGKPVVHTDQSFTVSAWVTPKVFPSNGTSMTAVSQDGAGNSNGGFSLQWSAAKKWVFFRWGSQTGTAGSTWHGAVATQPGQEPKVDVPTHLTGVYDGVSRELTIYVNGEYGGKTVLPTPAWDATGAFVIGRESVFGAGPRDFWKGRIDDVRAYSRKLMPEEVQGLVVGSDVASGAWALDGNTKNGAGGPDAEWSGAPQWTPGHGTDPDPADQAARFTGANAIHTQKAVTTTDSYTVSAWVKLDAATGCHCTILSQDAQHTSGLSLGVTHEGLWSMFASSGDKADDVPNGAWAMLGRARSAQAGVWTHVAGVHNKKREQLELYVNGALVESVPFKNPINATGRLQIGRGKWYEYPDTWVNYFRGDIDDVRVYSRALFAEELRVLAGRDLSLVHSWQLNDSAGSATAVDSIGARGGTVHGAADFGAGRVGNGGLLLDGVDDTVSTTGVDVRTDQSFTVTAWVKLADLPDCGQPVCARTAVSLAGGNGTSKFRLGHLIDQDQAPHPGKWIFEMPEDTGSVTQAAISVNPTLFNKWVLLVGVYDASRGVIQLYVYSDDPQVGVDLDDGLLQRPWQGTGNLLIGGAVTGGTTGQFWRGGVDDVRLYTGNLGPARLNALKASYPKPA